MNARRRGLARASLALALVMLAGIGAYYVAKVRSEPPKVSRVKCSIGCKSVARRAG